MLGAVGAKFGESDRKDVRVEQAKVYVSQGCGGASDASWPPRSGVRVVFRLTICDPFRAEGRFHNCESAEIEAAECVPVSLLPDSRTCARSEREF